MAHEHLSPPIKNQEVHRGIPKFPEGSLGFRLNEYLEGRERPSWLFEIGIDTARYAGLFLPFGLTNILRHGEITSIASLLSKSKQEFQELRGIGPKFSKKIEKRVGEFFERLKVTPEMRLLGAIYGFSPEREMFSLPAGEEKELRDDIRKALSSLLNERDADVIIQRFGLKDWRTRILEGLADDYGVSRERMRQIETKALRRLRHPKTKIKLQKHLPPQTKERLLRP